MVRPYSCIIQHVGDESHNCTNKCAAEVTDMPVEIFCDSSPSLFYWIYGIRNFIAQCYIGGCSMKFRVLQENLRKELWRRIDDGELTGLHLAAQTGFKQAHISNFLNRKRGLSLEGMDKVLRVQQLSVLDLIDPDEVNKRASIVPPGDDEFENIVVVDSTVAASEPRIMQMNVKEIVKFKNSFLRGLRAESVGNREHWERFVIIKADAREGMAMYPRLLPGATVLIDRHYNSLEPYRKGESSMYAVDKNGVCRVTYVEVAGKQLVLRPHNPAYPVEILTMTEHAKPADYLIGRVCYVGIET